MPIAEQVHERFKLFLGKLDASGNIGKLGDDVAAWVAAQRISPKSIGIEFIERSKTLILSIGYRADEEAYTVRLASRKIAAIADISTADLAKLEEGLGSAAAAETNVICHELYVTDTDELYMVTMAKT
jgi:hypothetical protein